MVVRRPSIRAQRAASRAVLMAAGLELAVACLTKQRLLEDAPSKHAPSAQSPNPSVVKSPSAPTEALLRPPTASPLWSDAALGDAAFEPPLEHEVFPENLGPAAAEAQMSSALPERGRDILEIVPGLSRAPERCKPRMRAPGNKCNDWSTAWALLDGALSTEDAAARDQRLWLVEACPMLEPGLVRALRAELDPPCGEVIVAPLLAARGSLLSVEWIDILSGLALASRLHRAIAPLPQYRGRATKVGVEQYRSKTLAPWCIEQMARLQQLEAQVNRLDRGRYGEAMAKAALAGVWHSLSISARQNAIPEEVKRNYEERSRYYGTMDQELAAARQRAESLDVVAATLLSRQGIRRSPIVNAWYLASRTNTVSSYVRALHLLRLPRPLEYPAVTPQQRVARRLPSYYAGRVFSVTDIRDVVLVRGLIENGLAVSHRRGWAQGTVSSEIAILLAHARVALGRRTWDSLQFDEAIRLLRGARDKSQQSSDVQLLLATAMAARSRSRNSDLLGEGNARITHWEALGALAEGAAPLVTKSFALANLALLRFVGISDEEAVIPQQLLERSFAGAAGTDLAPCLRELGMTSLKFIAAPSACTITEDP